MALLKTYTIILRLNFIIGSTDLFSVPRVYFSVVYEMCTHTRLEINPTYRLPTMLCPL